MKEYKRLEDFPVTYQRHFAPAVKEMLREWKRDHEQGMDLESTPEYSIDNWLADTSFDIADDRFGIPDTNHPSGEDKHLRMVEWRTLVEREAKKLIEEKEN